MSESGADLEILSVLDRWLDKDVRPNVLEFEHADAYPTEMVEQMREFGLFGATIPTIYGGLGLSTSTYAQIVERISEVWMSLTGVLNSHLMMAELVRRYGTEAQRHWFLPALQPATSAGDLLLPNPIVVRSAGHPHEARRTATGYVITGAKTWITNGGEGNCLAVLVKTDLEARPRTPARRCSSLSGPTAIEVVRRLKKLGYKGVDTCGAVLRQRARRLRPLIGEEEGYGFLQTVGRPRAWPHQRRRPRRGSGRRRPPGLGRVQQGRHTMGKPIGEHQAIAQVGRHGHPCAGGAVARRPRRRALDEGRRCDLEAGMAKLFASEAALENAPRPFVSTPPMAIRPRTMSNAISAMPPCCIGEGTNEIQRIVIAKRLLGE